jgi:hypothetical protein
VITDARTLGPVPAIPHTGAPGSAETNNSLDDRPRSLYEAVTRQMLEDLKADVAEVKGRVNTLLWLVAGAVFADIVMRLVK